MYMHMHMHESRFKYHQIILNHLLLTVSVTPLQVEFLATAEILHRTRYSAACRSASRLARSPPPRGLSRALGPWLPIANGENIITIPMTHEHWRLPTHYARLRLYGYGLKCKFSKLSACYRIPLLQL